MAVTINGTTGIANDGGYTGDGVVFADTTPANTLVTTTGGNVGIGTTNATVTAASVTQKLNVNTGGVDKSGIYIQHGNATAGSYSPIGAQYANNNTGSSSEIRFVNTVLNGASSAIAFATNDGSTLAERARIDSSGNLLVGTTSTDPIGAGVSGQAFNASTTTCRINKQNNTALALGRFNSTGNYQEFYYGSSYTGAISTNGSTTSYVTSSDYRLKENIVPMTGALTRVSALKPVTYTWKADGSADEGFIAHELQEVCPSAVCGEKDAVDAEGNPVYQGIDTSFLVATLTAAIQEQQAIITALTARVTALEGTQP